MKLNTELYQNLEDSHMSPIFCGKHANYMYHLVIVDLMLNIETGPLDENVINGE